MMKRSRPLIASMLLSLIFVFTGFQSVSARSSPLSMECNSLILGGSCILSNGAVHDGPIIILGGSAFFEEGSKVNGNIVLLGGTLEINGRIDGAITVIGSSLHLNSTSYVHGNVYHSGSTLQIDPQAIITEIVPQINSSENNSYTDEKIPDRFWKSAEKFNHYSEISIQVLFLSLLAIITAALMSGSMEKIVLQLPHKLIQALGLGILSIISLLLIGLFMVITLIGIPFAIILISLIIILCIFGWFNLGLYTGREISRLIKTDWSVPVSTGIGTLLLSIFSRLMRWIPCVGSILITFMVIIGLGSVIMYFINPKQQAPQAAPFSLSNPEINNHPEQESAKR